MAIEKVLNSLEKRPRASILMACGTGKTVVALWVAERIGARTVLILVPSLALVRQTLHEWLKQTSWTKLSYLCVCSDPTVDKDTDEWIVHQSDVDFRCDHYSKQCPRISGAPRMMVNSCFQLTTQRK